MSFATKVKIADLQGYATSQNIWPQQLVTGDFNGDSVTDFLLTRTVGIGTAPTTYTFLMGDSNHTWSDQTSALFGGNVPSATYVPRVAVADFNGDGRSDIYLPDFGMDGNPFPGGADHLWLSGSNGTMYDASSTLSSALTLAHGVSVGDINRDGRLDVVVDNLGSGLAAYSNTDFILMNSGNGQFSEQSNSLLPTAFRIGASDRWSHTWSGLVDLNNDGYPELILGTWDGAAWNTSSQPASQLLFNDGAGSFTNSATYFVPHSPISNEIVVVVQGMDLNGDGLQDLLLSVTNGGDSSSFYSKGYLQFLVNNGNGQFTDETSTRFQQDLNADGPWWKFIKVVDLNNDGAKDLVVIGEGKTWQTGVEAKVLLNDGTGHFTTAYTLPFSSASTAAVEVADVNGDSRPDLVAFNWASSTDGEINAYINDLPIGADQHANNPNRIEGSASADNIVGTAYSDVIVPLAGNDTANGGDGTDIVALSGTRGACSVIKTSSGYTVQDPAGAGGADVLVNVEKIQFSDQSLDLAQMDRLFKYFIAYYGRAPASAGLYYWLDTLSDSFHGDEAQLVWNFGNKQQTEFANLYGSASSVQDFVTKVFNNLFNRTPAQSGLDYWQGVYTQFKSQGLDDDAIRGEMVTWIMDGASDTSSHQDLTTLNNKVLACSAFTAAIDTPIEVAGYRNPNNTAALNYARDWLHAVTSDASTSTSYTETTAVDQAIVGLVGLYSQ